MRINNGEKIYILPEDKKINFLIDNIEKEDFIQCLYEFFGKKKKNYCQIFNNDDETILCNEIEFIYLPYLKSNIENNFKLKQKSLFNIELSNIIEQNPIKFQSIDKIRESLHDLLTDSGIFYLNKILSAGVSEKIHFSINEFDISKIIEMLEINQDNINEETKYMIVYNLLLYLNREKNCIIYIDFPITLNVLNWLKYWDSPDIIFLINNNFIEPCFEYINDYSLIKLSSKNFIEKFNLDISEFKFLSYTFHPFVQQNIELQSKKILNYFNQFNDSSTTFYLTFSNMNSKITDK